MLVYLINFGLFTDISVCKFLHGLAVIWLETFLFHPSYMFIHFYKYIFVLHIVPQILLGIMCHRNVHHCY